jgi:GNAT superfamily N-acetyltransferase
MMSGQILEVSYVTQQILKQEQSVSPRCKNSKDAMVQMVVGVAMLCAVPVHVAHGTDPMCMSKTGSKNSRLFYLIVDAKRDTFESGICSMTIEYSLIEMFSSLSNKQIEEIQTLLKQLSSKREFRETQFKMSMMFGSLFIASDKDNGTKVVGMGLMCYVHTALFSMGLIEDVVVLDSYRGHGIGKTIMLKLHEKAARHPVKLDYLELTSNPTRAAANGLYVSLGYVLRETNLYRLTL